MATIAELIAEQVTRISGDRDTIRAKLVELNLAVSTDTLDALAAAISEIVNRGTVNASVTEGETVTLEPGYYSGGSVAGVTGGGDYNLQEKTVTPTKEATTITSDAGYYGLSQVVVNPIPSNFNDTSDVTAAAGDVLLGKVIVLADGTVKAGTMPENGAVNKTLDANTVQYVIAAGHHNGAGKVAITLEAKTVTPTKAQQVVTPASGKVLSKVTVAKIPDEYIVPTGEKSITDNGKHDVAAYASVNVAVGSDPVELQEKTVSPSTAAQEVTPDNGYDGLSKVTVNAMPTAAQATPSIDVSSGGLITAKSTQTAGYVAAGTKSATKQLTVQAAQTITPGTSDKTIASGRYLTGTQTIKGDANLVAGNIAEDVTIFGVTGTHKGGGGMQIATGNFTPTDVYFASANDPIIITGLAFAPKHVIVRLAPIEDAAKNMSSSVTRQLLSISKGILDDNEIYSVYGGRAVGSKQTGTYYTLTLTDDGFVLHGSSGCGLFTLQYDYIAIG